MASWLHRLETQLTLRLSIWYGLSKCGRLRIFARTCEILPTRRQRIPWSRNALTYLILRVIVHQSVEDRISIHERKAAPN